ncbi:MAG TPA: DUF2283 domain-containing protein [Chloroflexota bacterium]|nr:DUF2283 domain-containing protein [Chloroflexota bacterium]
MKPHFDEKADALYVRLDDSSILESEEVHPGIVLDFNADDHVVGIEILGVRDRLPTANLKQFLFEVA